MEATTDGRGNFWVFNAGHLASVVAVLISVLGSFMAFTSRFEGHEYRIQALERSDVAGSSLPSRVTVLETRLDVVQAQLTQLNMTSNRTADSIASMKEDIATIKASLPPRGN